jgi:RHS repeat-associated protein
MRMMRPATATTQLNACQFSAALQKGYKFTGKERDAESNLDNFGARYYGSSMGRFMTPDWAAKPTAVPYAHYGNPQSLNLYSYVQNNPTTVGDPDGHCSSPKVGNGQVGVCIDLYIQAKTINVVGQGDNRGPAANDPKATYRAEMQLVADPKKGTVSLVKDDAGVSKALGGLISNKGTSTTSPITPTTDDNGTTHFTVNNTAMNGLHDLPGAPKDSIKTTINMDITSEGKVGIERGMRTVYPSLEIYSYSPGGQSTSILQMQEHSPSDLANQNQPIPQVAPQ